MPISFAWASNARRRDRNATASGLPSYPSIIASKDLSADGSERCACSATMIWRLSIQVCALTSATTASCTWLLHAADGAFFMVRILIPIFWNGEKLESRAMPDSVSSHSISPFPVRDRCFGPAPAMWIGTPVSGNNWLTIRSALIEARRFEGFLIHPIWLPGCVSTYFLSAASVRCETGLGDMEVGEGVQGLRQAFMVAGARTVVMSLWPVPDKQTASLMAHFCRQILRVARRSRRCGGRKRLEGSTIRAPSTGGASFLLATAMPCRHFHNRIETCVPLGSPSLTPADSWAGGPPRD